MYNDEEDGFQQIRKPRKTKPKNKQQYVTETPIRDRVATGCTGKEAFATTQLAHQVMRNRLNGKHTGNVYRCTHCHLFHIGRLKIK